MASRQAKFTRFCFYDQLLRCEIPVVAAIQGHAIGGGLVFGAYADVIVMAEECLYSTNFMQYGITSGNRRDLGYSTQIRERLGLGDAADRQELFWPRAA